MPIDTNDSENADCEKSIPELSPATSMPFRIIFAPPVNGIVNVPFVPVGMSQVPESSVDELVKAALNLPRAVVKPPCTLWRSPICGDRVHS